MKKSTLYIYFLFTLLLIGIGVNMTLSVMTTTNLPKMVASISRSQNNQLQNIGTCSQHKKLPNLGESSDRRIKKLYEYQEVCGSSVTETQMLFTTMPNSTRSAQAMAKDMAGTLREFHTRGITPIVVVEPENTWGLVDFNEFKSGFYNKWIDEYFVELKANGISDEQMGMWVPFPEANIPTWNKNSSTPEDFAELINIYGSMLKETFPKAKVGVLLNSATYDNEDYDWRFGEYVSLKPFVAGIKPGIVDSFGIQGFPWVPPGNNPNNRLINPQEYLNHMLIEEAATTLGIKNIWINTGTFSKKYTQDPTQTAFLTPMQRKTILDKTITEVKKLQAKGYTVSINLFAEDKSNTQEQTDWSYWNDYRNREDINSLVFKDFAAKLNENKIPLSIYDAYQITGEE